MASGRLPAPGSEHGPCDGDCEHIDCKATREQSATVCKHCGKPIGYETLFYYVPGREANELTLVHEVCELKALGYK